VRKRKRKRGEESAFELSEGEESDSSPNDSNPRSRLAKRIQTVHARKSHLSRSVVARSNGSSAAASPNGSSHGPVVEDTADSRNGGVEDDSGQEDSDDSDLDDWADEFERELD